MYNYYQPYGMPNSGAVPDALNQYKAPYQMQAPMQTTFQPQSNSGEPIWIQGEAGAKAYLVAPNSRVVLWDTESDTIYIKSADGSGIPSMRILDFKERNAPTTSANVTNYVTQEEFNLKFNELMAKYETLDGTSKNTKKVKGETDNG